MTLATGFGDLRPARPTGPKPKVLLVDDEPAILDGLRRQLRRDFDVTTALGGVPALEELAGGAFAVVMSDMRMPGMDGATLLAEVRDRAPDTVRMLLTGQADTESAIAAINDGGIFRFLTKPCAPDDLRRALDEAVALNRVIVAEKELLEQTLRGAVQALTDTLSLAHPAAFARAVRITRTVRQLAEEMSGQTPEALSWEVEVAAMLAHIGTVALPERVLDKLNSGLPLDEDERAMTARVPQVSRQLVASVPRLETVADAVGWQDVRFDGANAPAGAPRGEELPLASRLLRVAVDFDTLSSRRTASDAAVARLREVEGVYDPAVLDALARLYALGGPEDAGVNVMIDDLAPGMMLMEDVVSRRGIVLIGRGTTVTPALRVRLLNYVSQDGVVEPLVVSSQLMD